MHCLYLIKWIKGKIWNMKMSEDIKGVIRIGKSKKDRQHNGQKKKYKMTKKRSTKYYTYV